MDITNLINTDVSSIPTEDLKAAEDTIAEFIRSVSPEVDMSKASANYQVLVKPLAALYAVNNLALKNFVDGSTGDSPSLAQALLSSIGVEAEKGSPTTGKVTVFLNSSGTYALPADTEFYYKGTTFVPSGRFRATVSPSSNSDLKLHKSTNNQFYFVVPVNSTTNGSFLVLEGSELSNNIGSSVIKTIAHNSFVEGYEDKKAKVTLNSIHDRLSFYNLSSRSMIESSINNSFNTSKIAIVGANDPEMTRDSHNIFGIPTLGKVDVYVKSHTYPNTIRKTIDGAFSISNKSALKSIDSGITFVAKANLDDISGFYYCTKASLQSASSSSSVSLNPADNVVYSNRGRHLSRIGGVVSYVGRPDEASFSAYQGEVTLGITVPIETFKSRHVDDFNSLQKWIRYWNLHSRLEAVQNQQEIEAIEEEMDSIAASFGGAVSSNYSVSKVFDVDFLVNVNLRAIQDYINNPIRRSISSDIMVKSFYPLVLNISGSVEWSDYEAPDLNAIKEEISARFNSMSIPKKGISQATLSAVINSALNGKGYVVPPVKVAGFMYLPDDTVINITSSDKITVPVLPGTTVSNTTSTILTTPDNVSLTFKNV